LDIESSSGFAPPPAANIIFHFNPESAMFGASPKMFERRRRLACELLRACIEESEEAGKMTAIAPTIGPMDLFWIFIMVTSLQPVMKQRWIEASRRRLIAQIERKRGSRVILLAHRQETMSFLGFPLLRYIDVNDSEAVIRAIRLTDPSVPIDLILHTPGGLVLAATQIARAINRRKGKVTAIVPHYAMSGGTLIALAADEIIMSDHAVLGPVDPQLGQYPAASLLKAVEQKSKDRILDETLILADEAKKAIVQVQETVRELLQGKYSASITANLATTLSEGRWTHDFPITFDYAKELGLHVGSDMPPQVLELMALYPQPVRHFPTVEYLPGRRVAERKTELGEASGGL
jgi:ClpP class serine protease